MSQEKEQASLHSFRSKSSKCVNVYTWHMGACWEKLNLDITCPEWRVTTASHVLMWRVTTASHVTDTLYPYPPITASCVISKHGVCYLLYMHRSSWLRLSKLNKTMMLLQSLLVEDANKELSMQICKQLEFAYLRISFPLYPFQRFKLCI